MNELNEFGEMLKEALAGEAPLDPRPTPESLEASMRKFDQRSRAMRRLTFLGLAFMGTLSILTVVGVLRTPADASPRTLALYLMAFGFTFSAVGSMKFWLFLMQNDIAHRKELRRIELMILDLAGDESGGR